MKFVADGMLGSLVRWLRMMGYDVEYAIGFEDDKLVSSAKQDGRVLLTRDLELYRRCIAKGIDAFYVEGKNEAERLAALSARYGIRLEMDLSLSRCPRCNTSIHQVPKEKVADRLERNTFTHYEEFWECPKCKKVYWQGAHWPKIRETLDFARKPERR